MSENDVLLVEIKNLKEFFEKGFEDNTEQHKEIKKTLREFYDDHEKRVRALENWKLVFVAKYSTYSAIALFCGSLVATILLRIVSDVLSKKF